MLLDLLTRQGELHQKLRWSQDGRPVEYTACGKGFHLSPTIICPVTFTVGQRRLLRRKITGQLFLIKFNIQTSQFITLHNNNLSSFQQFVIKKIYPPPTKKKI